VTNRMAVEVLGTATGSRDPRAVAGLLRGERFSLCLQALHTSQLCCSSFCCGTVAQTVRKTGDTVWKLETVVACVCV